MKRVWIGAIACLAVVVGVMTNVQVVTADPAIVIKNDGLCGMPGSDANGELAFGGIGTQTTKVENDNKVMLKCKGTGITNDSATGQIFEGFTCGLMDAEGNLHVTEDTHATVSATGIGTMTCVFTK
jgi:hypothetical protein